MSAPSMQYELVRTPARGRARWRTATRVGLVLALNLGSWELRTDTDRPYYAGGPPILPDVLPGNKPDYPNYTWREYGQRVGVWRLFDLFDECGVKPSCTTNAVTALRRPQMLEAAKKRGCEILAHNYEQ